MVAAYEDSKVVQETSRRTLMGSHEIQGPKAKNGDAAPGQILDLYLFRRFPLTPVEFGHETGSIGKVMKLSFRAYEERPNQSPYPNPGRPF